MRAFAPGNTVLSAILTEGSEERAARALVIVEEQLVHGQPGLLDEIREWFQRHAALCALAAPPVLMCGGESCKNDWSLVTRLWSEINDAGIDRHSYVMVIGGGALLDLAGFAAATAHRGIRLIRFPTTTLSQGDGGVGVKCGVNFFGKKNWVGSFAVPFAVINDHSLLSSLPERALRDGIIEAVKVALIRDVEFYTSLEADAAALAALDSEALRRTIRRSAELHVRHICTGGDPFELGSARPLDFGHWIAHKLEQLSAFRVSHGEAVAIGIAADLIYARLRGLMNAQDCTRILALIRGLGFRTWDDALLTEAPGGGLAVLRGLEEFREHLGGQLCITLVTTPGTAVEVHEMDDALVLAALEELRAAA